MSAKFLALVLLVTLPCWSEQSSFNPESLRDDLKNWMVSGDKPSTYESDLGNVEIGQIFRRDTAKTKGKSRDDSDDAVNALICLVCDVAADAAIVARRLGATQEDIQAVVEELCIDLNIETESVCHGAIDLNLPTILWIVDNKPDLLGSRVCSIVFQKYNCYSLIPSEWSIDIPAGYSADRNLTNSPESPVQIIHLSDFHLDPLYTAGGNAKCGDPLCCQSDQSPAETEEAQCGYWGDYRSADSPIYSIIDAVKQSTNQFPDASFVYYTGDIISHRVWSTSVEKNTRDLIEIYELLDTYFDVPVYPVLGNHEPHPLNVWSPQNVTNANISTQWVFDLVAEQWSRWLPNDTQATILKGGYYTTLAKPGLRIIGLNSNVCYINNFYLIYDDEDPFDHLKWLVSVLEQAEADGESVHIISHVPTSDSSCLRIWSEQYRKIVDRFANTITGQFNGHTHSDIFNLYYNTSSATPQAVGVAFNGASVVTFTNNNPSFKVYYADASTFEVVDYDEWTYNLTLANLTPENSPSWFKLYSFKDAYGVDSLRPTDLDVLVQNFAKNRTLLEQYFRFKVRKADSALASGCDDSCHKSNLCRIVTSSFGDTNRCNELQAVYDEVNSG